MRRGWRHHLAKINMHEFAVADREFAQRPDPERLRPDAHPGWLERRHCRGCDQQPDDGRDRLQRGQLHPLARLGQRTGQPTGFSASTASCRFRARRTPLGLLPATSSMPPPCCRRWRQRSRRSADRGQPAPGLPRRAGCWRARLPSEVLYETVRHTETYNATVRQLFRFRRRKQPFSRDLRANQHRVQFFDGLTPPRP
jgi:hypothetical protein